MQWCLLRTAHCARKVQPLWLAVFAVQAALLRLVTDLSEAAGDLLPALEQLPRDQADVLLALRGLLGCGVLTHALAKRHLVDYGVDRWALDGKALTTC